MTPCLSRNAVQKKVNSMPGIAFTEDSLRDALTDLGAARNDKARAEEAIAACLHALAVFRERKMDDLAAGLRKEPGRGRGSAS